MGQPNVRASDYGGPERNFTIGKARKSTVIFAKICCEINKTSKTRRENLKQM